MFRQMPITLFLKYTIYLFCFLYLVGRKKVKYNVKSNYVCGRCGKIYLGQKRIQEHLEKFPSHKLNATEQEVDSELQDIFQNFNETPSNSNLLLLLCMYIINVYIFFIITVVIVNNKKETHTQTEVVKDRHCGYMKSKKNLTFHLKQVTVDTSLLHITPLNKY